MEPKKTIPKLKMQPLPPREPLSEANSQPVPPPARHIPMGRRPAQAKGIRPRVYRPRVSSRVPAKRTAPSMGRSLALQCMVCALIFLMVLGIQKLELPASNELVNGLRFVVSNDAEFVNEGRQQMGQWMEQAVAVFAGGGGLTVRQPAEGTAKKTEQGLVYTVQGPVRAVADGTVFYKGTRDDGTPYARLRHGGGYESLYEGILTSVSVGQELRAGDIIGSISQGEQLVFLFTQNGTAVDLAALASGQ